MARKPVQDVPIVQAVQVVQIVSSPRHGDCVAMTNSRQYCHPERSEGSAFLRVSATKKQILRRCAPQNDIETSLLRRGKTKMGVIQYSLEALESRMEDGCGLGAE